MAHRDRYDVVTRLLQAHRRRGRRTHWAPDCWHVVKPIPGDLEDYVVVQNTAGKKVVVPISQKDVNDLSDDELLKRIRTATSKIWKP